MSFRGLLILPGVLFATVAVAQAMSPRSVQQDDHWQSRPAISASSYRSSAMPRLKQGGSPFKFRQHKPRGPANLPPPEANDKAAVMGKPRPWQNGQPPVNCALKPMDALCH